MQDTTFGGWDYETAKGRVMVDLLRRYGDLKGKRVLEIGPSTGSLMKLLDECGATADGIDIDSGWSSGYAYLPERRHCMNLEYEELPSEMVGQYDLVIAQEVIEHIRRPFDFMDRLKQALKPGGLIVLTTPNLTGVTAWLKGKRWCGVTTPTHYILYSPRSLTFTMETMNLRPVDVFANFIPIARASGNPALCWINRVMAPLKIGGGLIGVYALK